MTSQHEITSVLAEWSNGDRQALEKLTPLVYDELPRARHYLRRKWPGHTLESTALVHEAYPGHCQKRLGLRQTLAVARIAKAVSRA